MLTIEQSNANCKASRTAMKNAVNAGKSAITANLVDEVIHSVTFKCPAGIATLVAYLDDQGLYKELRAVKKFALDFTGVSLKGENPSIDTERHNAAVLTYEAELVRLQELGIIGWYEQATGTSKDDTVKKADTPAQKQAKKQAKALDVLASVANDVENSDSNIMKMVLEYKAALEKVAAYGEKPAIDMHRKFIGQLTTSMMSCIDQLKAEPKAEPVQDAA